MARIRQRIAVWGQRTGQPAEDLYSLWLDYPLDSRPLESAKLISYFEQHVWRNRVISRKVKEQYTVRLLGSEDLHCLSLRLQCQSKSRTPIYKEALIAQPASALRHAKHQ